MLPKSEAGKGDAYRPVNKKNYDKNYNFIFRKRWYRKIIDKINYWLNQPLERKNK